MGNRAGSSQCDQTEGDFNQISAMPLLCTAPRNQPLGMADSYLVRSTVDVEKHRFAGAPHPNLPGGTCMSALPYRDKESIEREHGRNYRSVCIIVGPSAFGQAFLERLFLSHPRYPRPNSSALNFGGRKEPGHAHHPPEGAGAERCFMGRPTTSRFRRTALLWCGSKR
jgi:hypothetical protein